MAEARVLKLCSPAYGEPIFYKWPLVNTKKLDEATEIVDTIKFVCEDFPELRYAVHNATLKECTHDDFESMNTVCQRYNKAIRNILSLWRGRAPPPRMFKAPSKDLLRHILNMCYGHAISEPEKLNSYYEPFSPEVYGETSFDMISQILEEVAGSHEVFVDLGSGVGQVVLQAAASNQFKECIGVEKAEIPSAYAVSMEREFRKWMVWYGKIFTEFTLEKGDFMEGKWQETVNEAGIIFVNNFAFGPVVNHHLKCKFQTMKEGAQVVSSREFCPVNFKFNKRNLSELGAMMRINEIRPRSETSSVSWTGNTVSYYLHTVDRTRLEKYFSLVQKKKEGQAFDEEVSSLYSENFSSTTGGGQEDTEESAETLEENLDDLYLGTTTRHQWQLITDTIKQSKIEAQKEDIKDSTTDTKDHSKDHPQQSSKKGPSVKKASAPRRSIASKPPADMKVLVDYLEYGSVKKVAALRRSIAKNLPIEILVLLKTSIINNTVIAKVITLSKNETDQQQAQQPTTNNNRKSVSSVKKLTNPAYSTLSSSSGESDLEDDPDFSASRLTVPVQGGKNKKKKMQERQKKAVQEKEQPVKKPAPPQKAATKKKKVRIIQSSESSSCEEVEEHSEEFTSEEEEKKVKKVEKKVKKEKEVAQKEQKERKKYKKKATVVKEVNNNEVTKEKGESELEEEVDKFLGGIKRRFMDFLKVSNSKEYAERLKVMIQNEKARKKCLREKVQSMEGEVQHLIKEGLQTFSNRISELEVVVKLPSDLMEVSNQLHEKRSELQEKVQDMEKQIHTLEVKYKQTCEEKGISCEEPIAATKSSEVALASKLCNTIMAALSQRRHLLDKQSSLAEQIAVLKRMGETKIDEDHHSNGGSENPAKLQLSADLSSEKSQVQEYHTKPPRPVAFVPPRMLSHDKTSTVSPSQLVLPPLVSSDPIALLQSPPVTRSSLSSEGDRISDRLSDLQSTPDQPSIGNQAQTAWTRIAQWNSETEAATQQLDNDAENFHDENILNRVHAHNSDPLNIDNEGDSTQTNADNASDHGQLSYSHPRTCNENSLQQNSWHAAATSESRADHKSNQNDQPRVENSCSSTADLHQADKNTGSLFKSIAHENATRQTLCDENSAHILHASSMQMTDSATRQQMTNSTRFKQIESVFQKAAHTQNSTVNLASHTLHTNISEIIDLQNNSLPLTQFKNRKQKNDEASNNLHSKDARSSLKLSSFTESSFAKKPVFELDEEAPAMKRFKKRHDSTDPSSSPERAESLASDHGSGAGQLSRIDFSITPVKQDVASHQQKPHHQIDALSQQCQQNLSTGHFHAASSVSSMPSGSNIHSIGNLYASSSVVRQQPHIKQNTTVASQHTDRTPTVQYHASSSAHFTVTSQTKPKLAAIPSSLAFQQQQNPFVIYNSLIQSSAAPSSTTSNPFVASLANQMLFNLPAYSTATNDLLPTLAHISVNAAQRRGKKATTAAVGKVAKAKKPSKEKPPAKEKQKRPRKKKTAPEVPTSSAIAYNVVNNHFYASLLQQQHQAQQQQQQQQQQANSAVSQPSTEAAVAPARTHIIPVTAPRPDDTTGLVKSPAAKKRAYTKRATKKKQDFRFPQPVSSQQPMLVKQFADGAMSNQMYVSPGNLQSDLTLVRHPSPHNNNAGPSPITLHPSLRTQSVNQKAPIGRSLATSPSSANPTTINLFTPNGLTHQINVTLSANKAESTREQHHQKPIQQKNSQQRKPKRQQLTPQQKAAKQHQLLRQQTEQLTQQQLWQMAIHSGLVASSHAPRSTSVISSSQQQLVSTTPASVILAQQKTTTKQNQFVERQSAEKTGINVSTNKQQQPHIVTNQQKQNVTLNQQQRNAVMANQQQQQIATHQQHQHVITNQQQRVILAEHQIAENKARDQVLTNEKSEQQVSKQQQRQRGNTSTSTSPTYPPSNLH